MSLHHDPTSNSQIMEGILPHLSRHELLSLRLVNSSFRSMIDRELSRGLMSLSQHEEVTIIETKRGVLPFSRPGSLVPSQTPMLSTTVTIGADVCPSNRVRKILKLLPIDCRIFLDH